MLCSSSLENHWPLIKWYNDMYINNVTYVRNQIQFTKQTLDNDNNIINNFLEKLSISLQTKTEFPLARSFLFCNRWSWPPFSMPFQKSKWDSGTRLAPIQYTLHVSISTSVVNMRNVTGPSSSISISLYRRSNKGRIGHLQQQKGQQKCRSSNFPVHFFHISRLQSNALCLHVNLAHGGEENHLLCKISNTLT